MCAGLSSSDLRAHMLARLVSLRAGIEPSEDRTLDVRLF